MQFPLEPEAVSRAPFLPTSSKLLSDFKATVIFKALRWVVNLVIQDTTSFLSFTDYLAEFQADPSYLQTVAYVKFSGDWLVGAARYWLDTTANGKIGRDRYRNAIDILRLAVKPAHVCFDVKDGSSFDSNDRFAVQRTKQCSSMLLYVVEKLIVATMKFNRALQAHTDSSVIKDQLSDIRARIVARMSVEENAEEKASQEEDLAMLDQYLSSLRAIENLKALPEQLGKIVAKDPSNRKK